MSVAIGIAAVVFTVFDVLMWSPLPLDEGYWAVAIHGGLRGWLVAGHGLEDIECWRDS